MKNLNSLKETPFTNDEVMKLTKLYQFTGKDFYYKLVMKSDLESVIKATIETECYEFVKFFNLSVSDNKQNLIIKKNAAPKTNDEKLVSNFKKIMSTFQADSQGFELIPNQIYSLIKTLYNGVDDIMFNFTYENVQVNLLTEKRKVSARNKLEELLKKYESLSNSNNYEKTYIITNFFIDFINMNFFDKGNDFLGLLMLYILIVKEKFDLFKYVSFFEILNVHKVEFENAKLASSFNYEEGFSKSAPLQKLIIDMMLEGYNKIETMFHKYTFEKNVYKTDDIENTIYKLNKQVFTKDDIRLNHPYTSESTINRTLQRLRDQNIIRPNGVGRSASWIKLVDSDTFNSDVKQINLFEVGIEDKE